MQLKILILLILSYFGSNTKAAHDELSIIFVHLGNQLPMYLKYAVQQARLFNPKIPIVVIANQHAIAACGEKNIYDTLNTQFVCCEQLQKTNAHIHFLNNYRCDPNSWEGYWIKTVERFFYLQEFMHKNHDMENVFHLENDNTLYVDLQSILPTCITHYHAIGAIFDKPNMGRPGFIYFKNTPSITNFVNFIAEISRTFPKEYSLDMRAMDLFRLKFGKNAIDYLPIMTKEYTEKFELRNLKDQVAPDAAYAYYNNLEKFNSIFDGGPIGCYLGGMGPKNGCIPAGWIDPDCFFNVTQFTYEWIPDDQGRKVPYLMFAGKKYRINNLHIHSKNLHDFLSL